MSNENGQVNWSDVKIGKQSNSDSGKDLFLHLQRGSNRVRLLSQPFQYMQHKYKIEGGAQWGNRFNCSSKALGCPLCLLGDTPKRRWYVAVIEVASNQFKILDIGPSIFSAIQTYNSDPDWENPVQMYDLDIIFSPGNATQTYKVVAKPKSAMTAAMQIVRDEKLDLDFLSRLCARPTTEKVQEKFDKVMADIKSQQKSSSDHSEENNDGDDYFKSYDKKKAV